MEQQKTMENTPNQPLVYLFLGWVNYFFSKVFADLTLSNIALLFGIICNLVYLYISIQKYRDEKAIQKHNRWKNPNRGR